MITIDNYFEMSLGLDYSNLNISERNKYFEFDRLMNQAKNSGGVQSWYGASKSFHYTVRQMLDLLNKDISLGLVSVK